MSVNMRPGYKLTEVGMIPEDWDSGNLGRFWDVTDCKHITAEFVSTGGIPVASIREVQSKYVDLENAKKTTEKYYLSLIEGGRKPQSGDLIMSRNATVGEVAQIADWHPPFAMGQDVCLLRKKSRNYSTSYLQTVFQSPVILNQLTNLMVGSTFKRINVEQIRNFSVPMPSFHEQRAIAAALSDMDALISGLDQLIAKKRDIKQAAIQQLLTGKQRLPGFGGDWIVKTIKEVANVKGGKRLPLGKSLVETETSHPYLRVTDMRHGGVEIRDIRYLPDDVFPYIKNYRIYLGDIFISVAGSLGIVGKVPAELDGANLTENANRITDISCDRDFLLYNLMSDRIQNIIESEKTVGAQPKLALGKIESFLISLPSDISEQTAIATILSDMDSELTLLETRRDKALELKQGMMQELLTGRIRLL